MAALRTSNGRAPLNWILAALLIAPAIHAQPQANTADAALSINGTGKFDPGAGIVEATNSQAIPVPPGGAPLYWHRTQAHGALEVRAQGAPGARILLASGVPAPPVNLGGGMGFLELDPASLNVLVNGTAPANLLDLGAFIGGAGSWTLHLGQGLPESTPEIHIQAAIFDPAAPSGLRLTGSVTLETRNDLPTLVRNFVDAVNQAANNFLYGPSLCAPGFLWDGQTAAALFASVVPEALRLRYQDLLPNGPGPSLPSGAPATGQSVHFAMEVEEDFPVACPAIAATERIRLHGLVAGETGGVWKLSGNQQDAHIEARVGFVSVPPGTNLTLLSFRVEDVAAQRGGINTVSVAGPQLANLVQVEPFVYQAHSAAAGALPPTASWNGEEWFADVIAGSAGSSRQPMIPGDAYTFTITWNDGYTSPPYTIPLRAPVDPFASLAQAHAAIPGSGTPALVLAGAGQPWATLAITFDTGSPPAPGAWSAISFYVDQGSSEHEVQDLLLPTAPAIQTVTLCVPGLQAGIPTQVEIVRRDVFGNEYLRWLTVVL